MIAVLLQGKPESAYGTSQAEPDHPPLGLCLCEQLGHGIQREEASEAPERDSEGFPRHDRDARPATEACQDKNANQPGHYQGEGFRDEDLLPPCEPAAPDLTVPCPYEEEREMQPCKVGAREQ